MSSNCARKRVSSNLSRETFTRKKPPSGGFLFCKKFACAHEKFEGIDAENLCCSAMNDMTGSVGNNASGFYEVFVRIAAHMNKGIRT
jgi:hypothetical protein